MSDTIASLVRARQGDRRTGLRFEDRSWTHAEVVGCAAARASLALERRRPGPFHVGVLLDNVPEFAFWLEATAVAGATLVGINATRRGAELARDITHTECQLVVTERRHAPLLADLDLGLDADRILVTDEDPFSAALGAHEGAPLPEVAVAPEDLFLLLFTSGTTGAPKACRCSHGRLAGIADAVVRLFELGPDDVCYEAMPMFHSNALMAGWAPALCAGATVALRRRFSATSFLSDVRRFGVTYFNYVGRPLSYILATPQKADDADNPLRQAFGNEGNEADIARFAERFGCRVADGYGSTEGGATVTRTPDMPAGALGRAPEGTAVVDPRTGRECPPARFDAHGRICNLEEAVGELVSTAGASGFEGYWNNAEAESARRRGGRYWTGDLAYRDEAGFFYFAGRDADWLRVDGENFAAAPVERLLARHDAVASVAVYGVPDPTVGDQVMAALELVPGARFDPDDFAGFLEGQADLSPKWAPRFVRVCDPLPVTPTNKVLVRELRREAWRTSDPVWWRPGRELAFRPLDAMDRRALDPALERAEGDLGAPS
ncbi:MAG: long-chain-fatty-acid--CoA ligase [Acidimicrobiales bacterium]